MTLTKKTIKVALAKKQKQEELDFISALQFSQK